MAFWLHRIDVEEPGSPAHPPDPAMEQIRRVIQGWLEKALAPVAATLHRCGASANQVSAFGFVLTLAAAALVMGEGDEALPFAVVRGARWRGAPAPARALLRARELDLFRR